MYENETAREVNEKELEAVSGGTETSAFYMFELVDVPKCLNCGAENVRGRVTSVFTPRNARITTYCCNREMNFAR